tara:strand:- start:151 stop:999 length:849 start_codon:yes stop_codon:yes gene_type:complete
MVCKSLIPVAGLAAVLAAAPGPQSPPPSSLVGITVPCKMALVSPEQAGKIVELAVRDGERVTKDSVLFRLNSVLEELEVKRLGALANSDLLERRAKMTLEFAEQQATRMTELRDQDISSERDMQKQAHELAIAKVMLEQAQLERRQATNQLAQAKERLSQRTVLSPFDGIVTSHFRGTGEAVEKFVPVVEVMSLDPLWIEFECPIQRQQEFKLDAQVRVSLARRPQDSRLATIEFISSKATASSHSFTIRATVRNPELDWMTGLKMTVEPAPDTTPSTPSGK